MKRLQIKILIGCLVMTSCSLISNNAEGPIVERAKSEEYNHHESDHHHDSDHHYHDSDHHHESNHYHDSKPHHEEVTTHRPVLALPSFQIPLPQISFPQITLPQLHLPPLPQLPSIVHLPELPSPFKKETITATRTVFIETTKKVTRHPICVTAYGPKPPCLDSFHHDALRELQNNLDDDAFIKEKQPVIEPTKVVDLPSVRSTTILEGTESLPAADSDGPHPPTPEVAVRGARYLVPHPQYRSEPHDHDSERVVEGLLKNTHYITKTLYVTKIEKTIDHQVTATLVAKNCIPIEPKLPHCGPLHPTHGGMHVDWKDTSEKSDKVLS